MKVTIRPLQLQDAKKSHLWRNDPNIWKYTGNRPSKFITINEELRWISEVLERENECRFAIFAGEKYVGNVQLTGITNLNAEFHIFIGDVSSHGIGIGTFATQLILEHAKRVLKLTEVYLYVHADNLSAIRVYEKCGFVKVKHNNQPLIKYLKKL